MATSPPPAEEETSPLHHATLSGELDQLKRLVNEIESECEGENIGEAVGRRRDRRGRTVLHCAASVGNNDICDYLINHLKLPIDSRNDVGGTPLHETVSEDQFLTAVYLLENGANPNATNDRGITPLHFSRKKGFGKYMQLLISNGAEVNAMSQIGTALHLAAAEGEKDAVKILLDNHADPNIMHDRYFSPLEAAIKGLSIECVKLLLQAGGDPNISSSRKTPLEIAVIENETEIIKCLLAAGAKLNTRNVLGLTPLEVAATEGHHECVLVLFAATAPISGITDWSPAGVMRYVRSGKAKRKREKKAKEVFLQSKSKGEAAFRHEDYTDAISYYTLCSEIESEDATILSNRSLCWARLNEGCRALSDAQDCIALRPRWPKAYYREGMAWELLKQYKWASESFFVGWMLDTENNELKSAYMEALKDVAESNK